MEKIHCTIRIFRCCSELRCDSVGFPIPSGILCDTPVRCGRRRVRRGHFRPSSAPPPLPSPATRTGHSSAETPAAPPLSSCGQLRTPGESASSFFDATRTLWVENWPESEIFQARSPAGDAQRGGQVDSGGTVAASRIVGGPAGRRSPGTTTQGAEPVQKYRGVPPGGDRHTHTRAAVQRQRVVVYSTSGVKHGTNIDQSCCLK